MHVLPTKIGVLLLTTGTTWSIENAGLLSELLE